MPFPFVERERLQARLALIVSRPLGLVPLQWTLMVTSARRGLWPGDVDLGPDHVTLGLPVRCYVRTAKVAALETARIERRLGTLPEPLMARVRGELRAALSWV